MHSCCGCHRPGGYCPCCGRWLGVWPYRPWYPWWHQRPYGPYTADPLPHPPSITSVAHGEAQRAAALL